MLKPDREFLQTSMQYFMTATSEPGFIVSAISGGGVWPNGSAMDDADSRVALASNPLGARPVGLLLNRVVNVDLSRQVLNPYKFEHQINDKCLLLRKGWCVTNAIAPGQASGSTVVPCTGILGANGTIYTDAGYIVSGWPTIGKVLTQVDADGFAKVEINL